MNSLITSRVVLIDDEPKEALPILTTLGKLGIGCVYLKGDRVEDLPKQPLTGIRLIILDMRLGTTGGTRETATMTANVFNRVVSPEQGPLIVLLWTKHNEDVQDFREALFVLEPKFKSILLIANLNKPVGGITPATGNRVLKRFQSLAKTWSPIGFLWQWEQLAHDAATQTTALITSHVTEAAGIDESDDDDALKTQWVTGLREILRELSTASGGHNSSDATALEDLLETIIALHGDRIEQNKSNENLVSLPKIFSGNAKKLTNDQAAKLNGMVLVADAGNKSGDLRPGNVYLSNSNARLNVLFKKTGVEVDRLKKEILKNFSSDRIYQKHASTAVAKKGQELNHKQKTAAHKRDQRKTELSDKCIPMLLELTPSCDFAQRKRCVVRLMAGLLVPFETSRVIDAKNESLRIIDAVPILGQEGLWIPVFSSRLFYSIPDSKSLSKTKPAFRIRSQVLADLRNWHSSQTARPGYIRFSSD